MNKTSTAILSVAYLPSTDYFKVIVRYDNFEIEQYENYQKQSYRNRAHIYGANGLLPLIVPIERGHTISRPIREIKIDSGVNWQIQHWRAIVSAYNSSPFFDYYRDELYFFYNVKFKYLFDFNVELMVLLMGMLRIEKDIKFTSSFNREIEGDDYRHSIHPKKISPFDNESDVYHQVFSYKSGFIPRLSIIDLLFNEGPDWYSYI